MFSGISTGRHVGNPQCAEHAHTLCEVGAFVTAEMPVRAVPSRFMYRGLCSLPDILSYDAPVNLPEDEVEGK